MRDTVAELRDRALRHPYMAQYVGLRLRTRVAWAAGGDGIGTLIRFGDQMCVELGGTSEVVTLLACDELIAAVAPRALCTRTGEKWPPERVARHLVSAARPGASGLSLIPCLLGHLIKIGGRAAGTACGELLAALHAMAPAERSQLRDVLDKLDPEAELPACLRHPDSPPHRRTAAPGVAAEHLERAAGLLEDLVDALADHFRNPIRRLSSGAWATFDHDKIRERLFILAPACEHHSTYLVAMPDRRTSDGAAMATAHASHWDIRLPDTLQVVEASDPVFVRGVLSALWSHNAAIHGWLMRSLDVPVPGWHCMLAAAQSLLYRALCAGLVDKYPRRQVLKSALDSFSRCSPEQRKRLAGLAPEFVNRARRDHASLKSFDEAAESGMVRLLTEVIQASGVDLFASAETPLPPPAPATATATPPPPSEAAPRQTRVIRAKVDTSDLVTLEWSLAATPKAFDEAIATTLAWLGSRLGTTLPAHWSDGIHEIEVGGAHLEVGATGNLFAMRLVHPDSREVARTWRMEATLVRHHDGVGGMAGLRLSTLDRAALPRPRRSIPGLVHSWRESPGLLVAEGAQERAEIASDLALFRLRHELQDPKRPHPVWVFSAEDAPVFDRLPALAQLCSLPAAFSRDYGKALLPLEPGTWHAYAPGQSAAFVHPTTAAARHISGLIGASCEQHANVPRFRDILDHIRNTMQRRASMAAVGAGEAADEMSLPTATEDLQQQLDAAIGEREGMESDLAAARAEAKRLKAKLQALEASLRAPTASTDEAPPPAFPDSLAEIADWVPQLAPRVLFADKALKAASKVAHTDPELIYATLQALHDDFWPMRWGDDPDAKERWDTFRHERRLQFSAVGEAPNNHRYADAYQALVGGKWVTLNMHVQGSSHRDPRRCLRIYVHLDDDRQIVCVGSLPAHLDSSLS